ncbi:MAG: hypothetical protein QOI80_3554, partial [Solirubrobacteraceae bacterium]|nr:hypothetical protein [Solirubrobacteraceae bacterium]
MSELLWIAVPGGLEGGRHLLRVLIVPRLNGGTLAASGMAEWPPHELLTAAPTVTWRAGDDGAEIPGPA